MLDSHKYIYINTQAHTFCAYVIETPCNHKHSNNTVPQADSHTRECAKVLSYNFIRFVHTERRISANKFLLLSSSLPHSISLFHSLSTLVLTLTLCRSHHIESEATESSTTTNTISIINDKDHFSISFWLAHHRLCHSLKQNTKKAYIHTHRTHTTTVVHMNERHVYAKLNVSWRRFSYLCVVAFFPLLLLRLFLFMYCCCFRIFIHLIFAGSFFESNQYILYEHGLSFWMKSYYLKWHNVNVTSQNVCICSEKYTKCCLDFVEAKCINALYWIGAVAAAPLQRIFSML